MHYKTTVPRVAPEEPVPTGRHILLLGRVGRTVEQLFKDLAGLKFEIPFSGRVDWLKAQLIWQFLRFNPRYRNGYDLLKIQAADDDSGDLPRLFAQSWCLSTAVDYKNEVLPHDHHTEEQAVEAPMSVLLTPYFEFKPIQSFRSFQFLKEWGEVLLPESKQILVINPHASPELVLRALSEQSIQSEQSIKGLRQDHLIEYVVAHYFTSIKKMGPTEFTPIYNRIFGTKNSTPLHTSVINGKVNGFHEVASLAPWCFFTPPHR